MSSNSSLKTVWVDAIELKTASLAEGPWLRHRSGEDLNLIRIAAQANARPSREPGFVLSEAFLEEVVPESEVKETEISETEEVFEDAIDIDEKVERPAKFGRSKKKGKL